jgi:hypothetical protein
MAKYVVTGALVQVKANTADGASALVYVYRGGVVDLDAKTGRAPHLGGAGGEGRRRRHRPGGRNPARRRGRPAGRRAGARPRTPTSRCGRRTRSAPGCPASDAEAASKEDLVAIFGGDGLPEPEPAPAKRTVTRKS